MAIIMIKVTYPNILEANKTIQHLLKKRLISSANSFPIKSTSCWTGKIQTVDEIIVFLKTRKDNWKKARDEIKRIHPYEIPCILKIDVKSNKDYEDWVNNQTK